MAVAYVENVSAYEGNEISLRGWVYNKRSSGKLQFILLRDGTGIIQCVAFKGNFTPEQFDLLDKVTQETSIEIRGKSAKTLVVRADMKWTLRDSRLSSWQKTIR